MNLDNLLWFAFMAADAAVVGLLLHRRVWRRLPVFCIYCSWNLLSDVGGYVVYHHFPDRYLAVYLVQTVLDSALQFSVLVELTWAVLRPLRASLPRRAIVVIAVIFVAVGAAIWPFSGIHQLASLSAEMRNLVRLLQTTSILRILFFLALAGCSQLLSIGWRDRELQIATGLGFYSFVSLAVEILHSHQALGSQYRHLNQVVVASSVCSLLYWIVCFAQKEAERHEFTPQMQSFLLSVAGSARATRMAMTDAVAANRQRRE